MSTKTEEEKYPEHMRLQEVKDQSQTCGEFLDWLQNYKSIILCTYQEWEEDDDTKKGLLPINVQMNTLLAEYFCINEEKLEAEKRQMLDEIRAAQK